ncbi:DUF676-domain-containing protein [Mycena floridula]|nr:DUF676-domain-containing protein [Mycena floridula]
MHLHLFIHGMSGVPEHLDSAIEQFKKRTSSVQVLNACLSSDRDGIDFNAELILKQLDDRIKSLSVPLSHFSVTGYSLGGLVARYLVGILYHRGFFETVKAVNFSTFATPHAGLALYPHRFYAWMGSRLLARTGTQFYLLDKWSNTGNPLLEFMANKDSFFFQALRQFSVVAVYANAINDLTVPYYTGAFEESDPFGDISEDQIVPEYEAGYEPVLKSFTTTEKKSSRRLRSPMTFDGPLLEWHFPWSLASATILYLLTPFFILGFFVYASFVYLTADRRSRSRILRLKKKHGSSSLGFIDALPSSLVPTVSSAIDTSPNTSRIMTLEQRGVIRSLNELPNVRKYLVYRPRVRNSHAMIICLDPRFQNHRKGQGVLRHWADNFLLTEDEMINVSNSNT